MRKGDSASPVRKNRKLVSISSIPLAHHIHKINQPLKYNANSMTNLSESVKQELASAPTLAKSKSKSKAISTASVAFGMTTSVQSSTGQTLAEPDLKSDLKGL